MEFFNLTMGAIKLLVSIKSLFLKTKGKKNYEAFWIVSLLLPFLITFPAQAKDLNRFYERNKSGGQILFETKCDKCHPLNKALNEHKSFEEWDKTTRSCRERSLKKSPGLINTEERRSIVYYLVKIRGLEEQKKIPDDQALFENKCSRCHSIDRPLYALTPLEEWPAIIERMRQIAPVWITKEEAEKISKYLTENIKARKAGLHKVSKISSDQALFEAKCSRCHVLDRPLKVKDFTSENWVKTINRMRSKIPDWINPRETRRIIDYLINFNSSYDRSKTGNQILFEAKCRRCHSLSKPLDRHNSFEAWDQIVLRCRAKSPNWINQEEHKSIVYYLVKIRGNKKTRKIPDDRALFENKCSRCHSIDRPLYALKPFQEWPVVIDEMRQKAPVWINKEEAERIAKYLVKNIQARKAGLHKVSKISSDQALFETKCSRCHVLDRPLRIEDFSSEDWATTVNRMRSRVPKWISEGEAEQIVIYLNKVKNSKKMKIR